MIERMDPEDFDKVYNLMDMSFPYDEYRSYEEQKKLLNNSKYSIYVMHDDEIEDIKAFIAIYRLEDFAFIEHFVVNPNCRNQGIGSFVLQEMKKLLGCLICCEVELPETNIAERRIKFYERNGFYLNSYSYVQPPFSDDKCAVPLLVMTTDHPVNDEEFEHIKKTLYREVYHINDYKICCNE